MSAWFKWKGTDLYEGILPTIDCTIENAYNINNIFTGLKGSGALEISNRSGGHYNTRVSCQIQIYKLLYQNPLMSFNIVFRCSPYWYYDNISHITVSAAGAFVTNSDGNSSSITIDSMAKKAYMESTLQNSFMSSDFLRWLTDIILSHGRVKLQVL